MESTAGNVKKKYRLVRVSCEAVLVTPVMAAQWLSDNPHNRAIREERVLELSEKIHQGNWKPNPPIEVFDTGRLWNGQHRLSAIVRTGIAVEMRVCVYKKVCTSSEATAES